MGLWPFSGEKNDLELLDSSRQRMEILDRLQDCRRLGLRNGPEAGTFAQITVKKILIPEAEQLIKKTDVPKEFRIIYPKRIKELTETINEAVVKTKEYGDCVEKLLNLERSIQTGLLNNLEKAA